MDVLLVMGPSEFAHASSSDYRAMEAQDDKHSRQGQAGSGLVATAREISRRVSDGGDPQNCHHHGCQSSSLGSPYGVGPSPGGLITRENPSTYKRPQVASDQISSSKLLDPTADRSCAGEDRQCDSQGLRKSTRGTRSRTLSREAETLFLGQN